MNCEKLMIFDELGREVRFEMKKSGQKIYLNIGSIKNGLYYVKVQYSNGKSQTKQLIKD